MCSENSSVTELFRERCELDTAKMTWTAAEAKAAQILIDLALAEDLGTSPRDVTSEVMIPADATGTVSIGSREAGVLAGMPAIPLVFEALGIGVSVEVLLEDGSSLEPGAVIARLSGNLRTLLTGERTILNLLTHLSGIASLTQQYVKAVEGTKAVILDTRKTIPGYRALAKYAVRMGGGTNHRIGLYDGCLIKDNHLAGRVGTDGQNLTQVLQQVRIELAEGLPLEVEVDTLEQLRQVLPATPDIVLLDNMSNEQLSEAIQVRDQLAPQVLLEASGGVNLQTVSGIAASGVDRISIGALTHSAPTLDLGFDWSGE